MTSTVLSDELLPGATLKAARSTMFVQINESWDNKQHEPCFAERQVELSDDHDGYAFIVRRKFDTEDKYEATFLDIQHDGLADVVQRITGGSSGCLALSPRGAFPTINAKVLFHRRPNLQCMHRAWDSTGSTDDGGQDELKLIVSDFVDCLDALFVREDRALLALENTGKISYELL